MVKLKELIEEVVTISVVGSADVEIRSLGFDSREVVKGQMFFAVGGEQSDGHDYIESAVEAGAVAVVCERMPEHIIAGVTYIEVKDSHEAMGRVASAFYSHPSRQLKLIGITGTNGKTTTATLLYDLFRKLGRKVGLISTVVYCVDGVCEQATHTTPDAIHLNGVLARMVDAECEYCFMEVSSHSVVQRRIAGLVFAGGVFTNITHDHLDYHKTFAEYIRAKKMFFDSLPKEAFALLNIDDRNGIVMVQSSKAKVHTLSLRNFADFKCKIVEMHFEGMLLKIGSREVWVNILGRFNAYNLLSVYATAMLLGQDKEEVLREISSLQPVNGRFESIRSESGVTAIVDYAHTPDALQNVIDTINEIRTSGQRLFVVVGCGGNRDAAKRPIMAKIAATGSDLAILTSDNPRKEDPSEIISQMKAGLDASHLYLAITNRREAIRTAAIMARQGDIILIAGKGHETYQIVGSEKSHFDDKEEILQAFEGDK